MDIEKIEEQLADKRKSLEIIEGDIATKKTELDDRRKTYSRGILQHVGKGKQPASVQVQKEKVTSAEIEYQGSIGVKQLLEEEITGLEAELKLTELFESDGKRFNASLSTCGDLAGKMNSLGKQLNENMTDFNQTTEALFQAVEAAISSFSTIHAGLPRNYSLTSFLDGELSEIAGDGDHNDTLIKAGAELQSFALNPGFVPKLDTAIVEQFLEQVRVHATWQRTIAKRSPDGLIISHYALRPQKPKVIPLDGESARAGRALQVKLQAEAEKKDLKQTREKILRRML